MLALETHVSFSYSNFNQLFAGLSEEMFDDGYQHITNVDISTTVIKQMTELYREKYPTMSYKQMDVRSMTNFEDGTFDAVVDKGTFDSILCGDGSGPNAEQTLNEIHRVLSPNGVYICVSYGVKESRMSYFNKKDYDWTVLHHMVAKPTISTSTVVSKEEKDEKNFHWIYVMKKTPR
jgi:EEF1A lysine methyltransferase 4